MLVLTHDNPDPDSIASAVALAFLLEKRAGVEARVVYGGIIGRSENLALVKVLRLPISPVSQVVFDEHDLLALVDTQPPVGNHSVPAQYPVEVVLDHHPLRDESLGAPFADVGGRVRGDLDDAGGVPARGEARALDRGGDGAVLRHQDR